MLEKICKKMLYICVYMLQRDTTHEKERKVDRVGILLNCRHLRQQYVS